MRRLTGGPAASSSIRELTSAWVKLTARQRELVVVYAKRLANLPRGRR